MTTEKDWNAINPGANLNWEAEKARQWKKHRPYFLLLISGCILSLFSDGPMFLYILVWGGAVILSSVLYLLSEYNMHILKYGQKYPARVLDIKSGGNVVIGTAEIYLADGNIVQKKFSLPANKPGCGYSNKIYEWPKPGDKISVYYCAEKPKHAIAIFEQFKQ